MKRPKLKKASKRMTCHKRYKIQKKVREHHRKLRKEAKKRGHKKPKKDPGVPNSAPFKEALLREAELRKQQLEELKQQQKLDRQKEQERKRKLEISPDDEQSNVETQEESDEPKIKKAKSGKQNPKKLHCQELKKVIEASDIVLEVLDARDPLGCRCPQVEEAVIQSGCKKLVLVLNKSDLVPKENLENWLTYLNKELPTVVFKASTNLKNRKKTFKIKKKVVPFQSKLCCGKEALWKLLGGFQQSCGKGVQVGVVGFPNVGKSSIINSLKQERICSVGVSMGLTRSMQIVPLDKQITIIDSPCFIISPCNSPAALALRSPASIEVLRPLEAASAILSQADSQQVVLKYTVPGYKDSLDFFTKLAQRRGLHQKGGSPNVESAAKLLWSEWTGASLGYYCHPPASWNHSPHFNENITAIMKRGFNLEELEKNNAHSIQVLKGPHLTNKILFRSSGLTNGILEEKDIPEESPKQTEDQQDGDDQEHVTGEKNAEISDVTPVEETREMSPGQSTASKPSDRSFILDKMSEEDDAYDFTTDYI
ncbi:guanine nucleotide binding protein-like 3 (nucleolar), isoform CRA_b [Rattus norvegicus]|uniref:Guanine nucleotide-binding protein-like 3 n=3 Tax=Rattus norvegicus TaxID=10116 RepID=GNL3_RAT|nr:guanine nucleotide-binding protein-like 3 [Rattus norvegicus]Q811S9.1 RecName: Full=Guanine nucleotide-binding protein-like 3; AltName: Full=Nucleolar GTP-binding protein 3; AltName: Full=Nucleostemin [Rattus norvegicus]AAH93602.1 Guanine nucleotide binding protein-like 3 (nucleolar) [Rattus norvegicus]AAO19471.1 nucleostemin [Rattus norvegicus]EDL88968.1 guanine nucleotide binding protein-like 3 (nucleolar), isoform CRA_b [Rattus norvegicus]|eukprot:NP_783170.1 guanine nucleotide-binding protein-like 3 [Rattus norvegicus]